MGMGWCAFCPVLCSIKENGLRAEILCVGSELFLGQIIDTNAAYIATQLARAGSVARNPRGPDSSYDPSEPNASKKVHRGGSFLCTDQYCSRYIVGTRGKGEVGTGTNHLGFRCVRN